MGWKAAAGCVSSPGLINRRLCTALQGKRSRRVVPSLRRGSGARRGDLDLLAGRGSASSRRWLGAGLGRLVHGGCGAIATPPPPFCAGKRLVPPRPPPPPSFAFAHTLAAPLASPFQRRVVRQRLVSALWCDERRRCRRVAQRKDVSLRGRDNVGEVGIVEALSGEVWPRAGHRRHGREGSSSCGRRGVLDFAGAQHNQQKGRQRQQRRVDEQQEERGIHEMPRCAGALDGRDGALPRLEWDERGDAVCPARPRPRPESAPTRRYTPKTAVAQINSLPSPPRTAHP